METKVSVLQANVKSVEKGESWYSESGDMRGLGSIHG